MVNKYGMGARKDMMKLRKDNDSPGPGAYEPDANKVKKKVRNLFN